MQMGKSFETLEGEYEEWQQIICGTMLNPHVCGNIHVKRWNGWLAFPDPDTNVREISILAKKTLESSVLYKCSCSSDSEEFVQSFVNSLVREWRIPQLFGLLAQHFHPRSLLAHIECNCSVQQFGKKTKKICINIPT